MNGQYMSPSGVRVRVSALDAARNLSPVVLSAKLALPAPTEEAMDEWNKQAYELEFDEPGHVGFLKYAAQVVWDDYDQMRQMVAAWVQSQGLSASWGKNPESMLLCHASTFHVDSDSCAEEVFCVVWLSEDQGLDLVLPQLQRRVPLEYGTVVVFDSCQPHGVLRRGAETWDAQQYRSPLVAPQFLVSWSLPLSEPSIRKVMEVKLRRCSQELPRGAKEVDVDPATGAWTSE